MTIFVGTRSARRAANLFGGGSRTDMRMAWMFGAASAVLLPFGCENVRGEGEHLSAVTVVGRLDYGQTSGRVKAIGLSHNDDSQIEATLPDSNSFHVSLKKQ
jgi:hypothetical protein